MVEPENVAREKAFEVFVGARDPVKAEELPHQADICPSGKLELFKTVGRVEFGAEDFREGAHSGAARADERAVDIKQNQPDHKGVKRKHENAKRKMFK